MPTPRKPVKTPSHIQRNFGTNTLSRETLTKLEKRKNNEIQNTEANIRKRLDSQEPEFTRINKLSWIYNKSIESLERRLKLIDAQSDNTKSAPAIVSMKQAAESQIPQIKADLEKAKQMKSNLSKDKSNILSDRVKELTSVQIRYVELLRRLKTYDFRKGIYKKNKQR